MVEQKMVRSQLVPWASEIIQRVLMSVYKDEKSFNPPSMD